MERRKEGREAGSGQRWSTTPSIVASLATQVNIGCLNWIISSKGKDYRESGRKSRFIESLKWDKRKKSFVICMETGLGKFYIKLFIICGIRV